MIEVKNICKAFGDKKVLTNFNATFEKESVTCIMGDSGIGKTTLAHIIAGITKADCGEVLGMENMRIGMVFQENRLIEELSAIKNLLLVYRKENMSEILSLLKDLGLSESMRCPVSSLSGGMKRRVSIARALINPADVYIFDEPFKELDEERKENVRSIIKNRTRGATVIFITHDSADIKALAANVVNIK